MDNENVVWAKTLLIAYKYLGTLCRGFDKEINSLANNSMYIGGNWNDRQSVIYISNKILELTQKKMDFINIKVLVEKTLKNINTTYAKLLILKYIKELNANTVCNLLNMSERTFFRKLNNAVNEFSYALVKIGYSHKKLNTLYSDDLFIKSIYNLMKSNVSYWLSNIDIQEDLVTKYFYKVTNGFA